MTDNTPILLIAATLIGLIGLAIGAAIGVIVSSFRNPPNLDAKSRKGLDELARLWRNPRSGDISVEMKGKMIGSGLGLTSTQRSALIRVYDELQLWLGVDDIQARASGPSSPSAAEGDVQGSSPGGVVLTAAAATAVKTGGSDKPKGPPIAPPQTTNVRPPSMQLGDILAQAINPTDRAKSAPEGPKTIAGQVDAIIQERLPQSAVNQHTIQLLDSVDGGIVVWIDGQKYNSIPDVSDPDVRAFIQTCVGEWEKRYGK